MHSLLRIKRSFIEFCWFLQNDYTMWSDVILYISTYPLIHQIYVKILYKLSLRSWYGTLCIASLFISKTSLHDIAHIIWNLSTKSLPPQSYMDFLWKGSPIEILLLNQHIMVFQRNFAYKIWCTVWQVLAWHYSCFSTS